MSRDPLDILRQYQAWRTGQDERPLAEQGFSPQELTRAIDALISEVEKCRDDESVCSAPRPAVVA